MVLPPEPIPILHHYCPFRRYGPLFYVNRNLQEVCCILDGVVKKYEPARVDLEIGVRNFKLLVDKIGELVFNELDSFLNAVEVERELFLFFALLQKLEAIVESTHFHLC